MTAVLTRNRSLGRSTSGNVAAALAAAHAAPRASPAPAPPAKAGVAKADHHRTTATAARGARAASTATAEASGLRGCTVAALAPARPRAVGCGHCVHCLNPAAPAWARAGKAGKTVKEIYDGYLPGTRKASLIGFTEAATQRFTTVTYGPCKVAFRRPTAADLARLQAPTMYEQRRRLHLRPVLLPDEFTNVTPDEARSPIVRVSRIANRDGLHRRSVDLAEFRSDFAASPGEDAPVPKSMSFPRSKREAQGGVPPATKQQRQGVVDTSPGAASRRRRKDADESPTSLLGALFQTLGGALFAA